MALYITRCTYIKGRSTAALDITGRSIMALNITRCTYIKGRSIAALDITVVYYGPKHYGTINSTTLYINGQEHGTVQYTVLQAGARPIGEPHLLRPAGQCHRDLADQVRERVRQQAQQLPHLRPEPSGQSLKQCGQVIYTYIPVYSYEYIQG
jgi:hypothetical protein